jgi:hypothetical protein
MALHKRVFGLGLVVGLAVGAAGCDSSSSSGGGASMGELAGAMSAQSDAEQQKQEEEKQRDAERRAKEAAKPREPQIEVVTAHSPKKGRSLEGGGYLSVVTGTRFWAEHQMTLNVVRKNLDLYKAERGYYPKTQEDFMRDIIERWEVNLPELPEGWEYYYDPETPLELKMIDRGGGDPNAVQ